MQNHRLNIVVAESSPLLRRWLAAGLGPLAANVIEVETGRQLLDVLGNGDQPVDLLVVGERFPGPGGAAVLAALRGAGDQLPFLLVSSLGRPSTRAIVNRAGGAALLDDPFDTSELRRLAEELVVEQRAPLSAYAARAEGASRPRRSVG